MPDDPIDARLAELRALVEAAADQVREAHAPTHDHSAARCSLMFTPDELRAMLDEAARNPAYLRYLEALHAEQLEILREFGIDPETGAPVR